MIMRYPHQDTIQGDTHRGRAYTTCLYDQTTRECRLVWVLEETTEGWIVEPFDKLSYHSTGSLFLERAHWSHEEPPELITSTETFDFSNFD